MAARADERIDVARLADLKSLGISEAALRRARIKRLTVAQRAKLLGVRLPRGWRARTAPLCMFSLTPRKPIQGKSYLQLAVCQFFDPAYPTLTGPSPTGDAWFDNQSLSSYPFSPSVAVCFHGSGKALVEVHVSVGVNDVPYANAQFRVSWRAGTHYPPSQDISISAPRGGAPHVITALCDPQGQTGELQFFATVEQIDPPTDPQIWWRFHSASITTTA